MTAAEAVTEDVDLEQIAVRQGVTADVPFIFSSWLKSYRANSPFARSVSERIYFDREHAIIERILARGRTLVAHVEGDPDTILGYLVAEQFAIPAVAHWLYVKGPWRRAGIASKLVEASGLDMADCHYTHQTKATGYLLHRWPGLTFDPWLL